MEAPENIYVNNPNHDFWYHTKNKNSIEYTRTDAFIKKACDAYCKVCGHYAHKTPTHICRQNCDYFENFKRYIKGDKV